MKIIKVDVDPFWDQNSGEGHGGKYVVDCDLLATQEVTVTMDGRELKNIANALQVFDRLQRASLHADSSLPVCEDCIEVTREVAESFRAQCEVLAVLAERASHGK